MYFSSYHNHNTSINFSMCMKDVSQLLLSIDGVYFAKHSADLGTGPFVHRSGYQTFLVIHYVLIHLFYQFIHSNSFFHSTKSIREYLYFFP